MRAVAYKSGESSAIVRGVYQRGIALELGDGEIEFADWSDVRVAGSPPPKPEDDDQQRNDTIIGEALELMETLYDTVCRFHLLTGVDGEALSGICCMPCGSLLADCWACRWTRRSSRTRRRWLTVPPPVATWTPSRGWHARSIWRGAYRC